MEECSLLENCGFFKKYKETRNLACQGFINLYCKGAKMNECKRKKYKEENGQPPSDDMMPSGQMIVD